MTSVRCDLGVATVVTKNSSLLLVKEASGKYSNHWGLPKGLVNENELPRDAALRELKEECDVTGKVTGIHAIREYLSDIGPAVFIAYSVELDLGQVPKPSNEIAKAEFIDFADFDNLLWVSEAMKSISVNALSHTPFSTVDFTKQRGHPYLLHLPSGVIQ